MVWWRRVETKMELATYNSVIVCQIAAGSGSAQLQHLTVP